MNCSNKCICGKDCIINHQYDTFTCSCDGKHNRCEKKCKKHGYCCDWVENHVGDCTCFVEMFGDCVDLPMNCVEYR